MWDVAMKMNSSMDSTNAPVANLKPLHWAPYGHVGDLQATVNPNPNPNSSRLKIASRSETWSSDS